MNIFLQNNLALVFERTKNWGIEEVTLNMDMIRVLATLDGRRSLAEVAQLLELSGKQMMDCIQRLYNLQLIQPSDEETTSLSHVMKTGVYRGIEFVHLSF